MMHEDSPKMSVAQGLAASTSQAKSDIVLEGAVEYEMSSADSKPDNIAMEIKISYMDPTNGTYDFLLRYISHVDIQCIHNVYVVIDNFDLNRIQYKKSIFCLFT